MNTTIYAKKNAIETKRHRRRERVEITFLIQFELEK